ncbi:hypothetical protein [Meridianimarinicoccus roseus]|uniref:hypothetical protein n=1 Tax=Meridianimarinicoccus roseus TaxID=2072018 RepID=UPI0011B26523|nr:hypothetical protein [Meridianimarinicoccus roseus]
MFDYLRGPNGTPAAKNRILRSVMACRKSYPETAGVLLTLALWPALENGYRKLCRGFPGDPDGVAAELLGAFCKTAMEADLQKVHVVAATLTRNAKRDATVALLAQKHSVASLDPKIEGHADSFDGPSAVKPGSSEMTDAGELRDLLLRDFGSDGALAFDVIVNNVSQRDAARRRAESYDVTRKRYQRTVKRIREQRPDYLVPRVPMRAPDWHLSQDGTGQAGAKGDTAIDGTQGSTRTSAGVLPGVGTSRHIADRRRVPDRTRGRNK